MIRALMKRTECITLLVAGAVLLASGCVRTVEDMMAEQVLEVRAPNAYLTCARTGASAPADTQMVGPAGARLAVGSNDVTIPANAIPEQRQIVFSLASGDSVGVVVDAGQPLAFANRRSARIMIDLRHCSSNQLEGDWYVWRMNLRNVNASQKLAGIVAGGFAITHVDSISSFMIAN